MAMVRAETLTIEFATEQFWQSIDLAPSISGNGREHWLTSLDPKTRGHLRRLSRENQLKSTKINLPGGGSAETILRIQPLSNEQSKVDWLLLQVEESEQSWDDPQNTEDLARELQQRRQEFQTLAEHAPDIICRFDQQLRHTYVNPAIERATTIPPVAFIGKTPFELELPPEFADYWAAKLSSVFTTSNETTMEFTFQTPVGPRHFQSLIVPEFDAEGAVASILSISRDITHMKEQEQQKDAFLGMVSHELKTPITSIKAFAQVLMRKMNAAGDTQSADQLLRMDVQLNKLNKLVCDLLDSTNFEQGRVQLQQQPVLMDRIIQDVVGDMQLVAPEQQLETGQPTGVTILADHERIGQVLINFISNAIKYAPHGKKIIISSQHQDKEVVVCVQDFGQGIAPEVRERIFERYYRANEPGRGTTPGLGLGLHISAEIIRRHGGRIWVESEPGQGATFCFALPLHLTDSNPVPNQ
jgi:PAS domain S-box-containing protein